MKKVLFIAAIGVAGLVSAKGNVEKVSSKAKKITDVKKSKKKREVQCATFQASCTSAYTCQDWTADQWIHWGQQIQNNYCQL
ncbi:hypothetical protein [Chryseobacterium paludis]|uniref:hypothetical protein n=1 Tax=Chryseobacterium paludis TaxID=2956784 RepID=UPI0021C23816|nr:hypothetical protein [Chryseobacterium paludis]